MIHLSCPGCSRVFDLADVLAGQVISCPDCERRIYVEPQPAVDDEPILLEEAEAADQGIQELPEEQPSPFGIEPKRLKTRRIRIKKKRRSPTERYLAEQWAYFTGGFGPFGYVLLGLFVFWLLMLLATPLLPRLYLVLTIGGSLLYMVGWWWIIFIAYRDDGWSGTMCVVTMFYTYVYAYLNMESTWRPAGLLVLGLLMQITGYMAGIRFGAIPI